MKRFLFAASLLLLGTPAFAVCPSPLTGKDASGTTQNFGVTVDASGNCYGNISIVDGTNAANKATVSSAGSLHTLDDNSAAALAAITSPVPYLTATAWNTNTYTNGQTNPGTADLHGAKWIDIGALGGTALGTSMPVSQLPSSSSTFGIAPTVAGSAASNVVLKSGAGNLYNSYATCTATCWLMIFNATTAPSDGATTAGNGSGNLQDCVPIPSGGVGGVNYNPGPPEVFSVGITAVISSTACGTKTAASTGFIHGSVQ